LTRANTTLIPHAVCEVTPRGVVAADGTERPADVIIFATGFSLGAAMPTRGIFGSEGVSLAQRWARGPQAFNGTTVSGFPNLVLLLGPHTGLGHNSVLIMLEAQIGYLLRSLQPRMSAEVAYNAWLRQRARNTVFERGGCNSWYLDGTGHSLLWPDFSWRFTRRLRSFDIGDYQTRPAQ
jgi:cation diffusion facilitator CzcD-associated flavoprotein CzcO